MTIMMRIIVRTNDMIMMKTAITVMIALGREAAAAFGNNNHNAYGHQ
jgi:hypothetical protein